MAKIKFKLRNIVCFICVLFLVNTRLVAQDVGSKTHAINSNINFVTENLKFLASDSLKGRHPGSEGDSLAAYYIAFKMEQMGFVPLIGDSFVVPFYLTLHRKVESNSYVKVGDKELIKDSDYSISPLSPKVLLTGIISSDTSKVVNKEKNVIALIYSPKDSINFKITPLIEKGFSAVLFYSKGPFDFYTNLKGSQSTVPVIMISEDYAEFLKNSSYIDCEINSNTQNVAAKTYNVAGITSGNKGKYIMAGAHYDHLGMGGKNSGSMDPDTYMVHPGADDNASGVSAILEIGRLMSKEFKETNNPNRVTRDQSNVIRDQGNVIRDQGNVICNQDNIIDKHNNYQYDIAICAFGAEEKGLVGSTILADTLLKLNKLPALMINLDMVGRLKDNKLQVGGAGTFVGADSLLAESNEAAGFELIITKEGMGPSDHSSFYSKKVPVLYFTTGVHKQYHTPADSSSLINFEGLKSVTDYVANIIYSINKSSFTPVYSHVEQQSNTVERTNLKVTLGIIPDFTYEKGDGFRIGPVSSGRPAYNAGLVEGDLIIKMGDKKINNIYDYMSSLGDLKKGQSLQISIIREGVELVKLVNL